MAWNPEELEDLLFNEDFSNCYFLVGGEKFYAHTNILQQRCVYFAAKLSVDQHKMNVYEWPDIPAKQFREVLRFVYLARVEVDGWNANELVELLRLAKKFYLKALVLSVTQNINMDTLTLDVVSKVFDAARDMKATTLMSTAVRFACQDPTRTLADKESFTRFSADFMEAILDNAGSIVEHPNFLNAILQWQGRHSGEDVTRIFAKIKWRLLPSDELERFVHWLLENRETLAENNESVLSRSISALSIDIMDDISKLQLNSVYQVWSSGLGDFVKDVHKLFDENDEYRETHEINKRNSLQINLKKPIEVNTIRFDIKDSVLAGTCIADATGKVEPLKALYRTPTVIEYEFPTCMLNTIEIYYYERLAISGLSAYLV